MKMEQFERARAAVAPRGAFSRRGALATGGLLAAALVGVRSNRGADAASLAQDVRILNFFLLLERLQLDFYSQAAGSGALTGELAGFARVVAGQERAHVRFLEQTLGAAAAPRPKADFGESTKQQKAFVSSAVDLEESASGSYIAQAPHLTSSQVGRIAGLTAVEARQTAWIRSLAGDIPAPSAADPARSEDQVLAVFKEHGGSIQT